MEAVAMHKDPELKECLLCPTKVLYTREDGSTAPTRHYNGLLLGVRSGGHEGLFSVGVCGDCHRRLLVQPRTYAYQNEGWGFLNPNGKLRRRAVRQLLRRFVHFNVGQTLPIWHRAADRRYGIFGVKDLNPELQIHGVIKRPFRWDA